MLAESLFKVFDDDNSGTFSFEEYYQVILDFYLNVQG